MIKKITKTVLGILVVGAFPAFAQQYQTSLDLAGDEYANKVLIDGNNVSLVGSTNATGAGGYDLMFMGGDNTGSFTEGGQVGGTGNETARAVVKLASGNTIVAGASNSYSPVPNTDDFLVINLPSGGGNPVWITVLGTDSIDRIFSVKEGNDGNIIVTGQLGRSLGGNVRLAGIVVKLDASDGSVIWSKRVGTDYINHVFYDVEAVGFGYIAVGFSGANVIGLNDVVVVLLNEDGTKSNAFFFGGPGDDDARDFIDAGSGTLFIAGNARNVGQGNGDVFLARFDVSAFPTISMDWFKVYGGTSSESFQAAVLNSTTQDLVLVGTTQSFGTGGEAFALGVDFDGNLDWSNVYGGTGADYFQGVGEDGTGGYIAAGYSNSFGGTANDAWVVRMDATGASGCGQSTAAFVEETIAVNVAYAVYANQALTDIVSTDTTLTARDVSTIAFNQNTIIPTTQCTTVSIDENSASNIVGIYPNPAGSSLNFNFGVNAADAKGLVIYNSVGAKAYETTLNNVTSVFTADISNLANGMYTAVAFMNDTQVTAKFTVAK